MNVTDEVSKWLGIPHLSLAWRDAVSCLRALRHLEEDLFEISYSSRLPGALPIVRSVIHEIDEIEKEIEGILKHAHERMIPAPDSEGYES